MSTRAVSSYQNALRYDPSDSTIVIDIARNLHKDGKYRDAQKFYIAYEARFGQTPASKNGLEGVRLAAQYKENKTRFIVKRAEILNQRMKGRSGCGGGWGCVCVCVCVVCVCENMMW